MFIRASVPANYEYEAPNTLAIDSSSTKAVSSESFVLMWDFQRFEIFSSPRPKSIGGQPPLTTSLAINALGSFALFSEIRASDRDLPPCSE
jgi:hypothetical protein